MAHCGSGPHIYTAQEVYPLAAGQKWDMRDLNGNITHFEVIALSGERACQAGPFLGLHITKTAPNAYWWPYVPGAWGTWMFRHEQGTWNQPVIIAGDYKDPLFTYQYGATPGYSGHASYFWFPPNLAISEGQTVTMDTAYTSINHLGADLSSCMTQLDNNWGPSTVVHWHVETTVQYVTTPVYSGKAVVSKMCEGQSCRVAGETFWFAPRIGIVKIVIQGGDGPPGYTTARIN